MLEEMQLSEQPDERFTSEQWTAAGIEQFAPACEDGGTHRCRCSNFYCKAFQEVIAEHSEEITKLGELAGHIQVAFATGSVHQFTAAQADSAAVPVLRRFLTD